MERIEFCRETNRYCLLIKLYVFIAGIDYSHTNKCSLVDAFVLDLAAKICINSAVGCTWAFCLSCAACRSVLRVNMFVLLFAGAMFKLC